MPSREIAHSDTIMHPKSPLETPVVAKEARWASQISPFPVLQADSWLPGNDDCAVFDSSPLYLLTSKRPVLVDAGQLLAICVLLTLR